MSGFRDVMKRGRERCRGAMSRWNALMERQGFYVMLGVCVAIIVGTAVWTRSGTPPVTPPEYAQPDAETGNDAEFVQQLSDVIWTGSGVRPQSEQTVGAGQSGATVDAGQSAAVPGADIGALASLNWPVSGEIFRPHTGNRPVFMPTLDAWSTHDGIDIQAAVGDPVNAALSGTVSAAREDPLLGSVLELQHPGGLTTRYAGLATLSLLQVGDPVKTGQLLSPLGKPGAWESQDPPHLHFEVLKDGEWVDPQEHLVQK